MKKFDSESLKTKNAEIVSANNEVLKALVPDAFTEDCVDPDVLKKPLHRAVDEPEEKYGLNWHCKLCTALDSARLTKEINTSRARPRPKGQLRCRMALNIEMQKCDLNSWRVWGGYNG
jgi:hypothetical protein